MGQTASDDTVVPEEILEGTHDGALVLPDGSMPASGATPGNLSVRVRGEEIVSLHLYWDNIAVLRAVGAVESPAHTQRPTLVGPVPVRTVQ